MTSGLSGKCQEQGSELKALSSQKKYCDVVDARTYIEKPFKDGNAAQLLLRKTLSDLEAAE